MKVSFLVTVMLLLLSSLVMGQTNSTKSTTLNNTNNDDSNIIPAYQLLPYQDDSEDFFYLGISSGNYGLFDTSRIKVLNGQISTYSLPGFSLYGGGSYEQFEWEIAYNMYNSVEIYLDRDYDSFMIDSETISGRNARVVSIHNSGFSASAKYNFLHSDVGTFFVSGGLNTISQELYIGDSYDIGHSYNRRRTVLRATETFLSGNIGYKFYLPGQSRIRLEFNAFDTHDDLDKNALSLGYVYYFSSY